MTLLEMREVISKDEETLLTDMHSKTRYNIGLSDRKGVRVEQRLDAGIFWQINKQTTKSYIIISFNKNTSRLNEIGRAHV